MRPADADYRLHQPESGHATLIKKIELAAKSEEGRVTLSFTSGATNFATFLVVTNSGEELWQLHPRGMQQSSDGGSDVAGLFVSAPIAPDDETKAMEFLEKIVPESDNEFTQVDRIVYGCTPEGYTEVAPAKPLVSGGHYRVIVLKVPEYATLDFMA